MLLQVGSHALGVGLHALLTLLPAGGADLAVLLVELQRVDEAQGLVDRAAEGQVVDGGLANQTGLVDEEGAAERDAVVEEDAVGLGDVLREVRNERVLDGADATVLDVDVSPGTVRVDAVDRDAEDLDATLLELFDAVREREDLGRARR